MTIGVQAVQSLQRMKHIVQIQKDENSRPVVFFSHKKPASGTFSQPDQPKQRQSSPLMSSLPARDRPHAHTEVVGGREEQLLVVVESGDWTLEASAPLRAAGNPRVPTAVGGPWTDGAAVAPVPVPLCRRRRGIPGQGAIDRSWAVVGPVFASDWACCTLGWATFGQSSRQRAPSGIASSDRRVRRRDGSA
jgi:hypothetical protein